VFDADIFIEQWMKMCNIDFIFQKFTEQHPHIAIKFAPTPPSDYNDVIETQLKSWNKYTARRIFLCMPTSFKRMQKPQQFPN